MNCDTAFDLMTDPHGSRSGALALHFQTCPRCRQMQETLAPALEFMIDGESPHEFSIIEREVQSAATAPDPFVTADAVQIAWQAGSRLALRSETPRARFERLVRRSPRYAAAFAAGLLFAVVVFNQRDRNTMQMEACTRQEASRNDSSRTIDQIQALAQSCTLCHQTSSARSDDRLMNGPVRRIGSWDWLIPILENQTHPFAEISAGDVGQNMIASRAETPHWRSQQA